jgi:hypothetical protein
VVDLDFSTLSHKSERAIEMLYLWCKEGWVKSALGEYHTQKQALSRYFLGAIVLTDPIIDVVRRELRRMSPDVRIDSEEIRGVLINEVIKRDVLEGEKAEEAKKKVARAANTPLRASSSKEEQHTTPPAPPAETSGS